MLVTYRDKQPRPFLAREQSIAEIRMQLLIIEQYRPLGPQLQQPLFQNLPTHPQGHRDKIIIQEIFHFKPRIATGQLRQQERGQFRQ